MTLIAAGSSTWGSASGSDPSSECDCFCREHVPLAEGLLWGIHEQGISMLGLSVGCSIIADLSCWPSSPSQV